MIAPVRLEKRRPKYVNNQGLLGTALEVQAQKERKENLASIIHCMDQSVKPTM